MLLLRSNYIYKQKSCIPKVCKKIINIPLCSYRARKPLNPFNNFGRFYSSITTLETNMNPYTKLIFERLIQGDQSALSKCITLIESKADADAQQAEYLLNAVYKLNIEKFQLNKKSIRIGVTGSPGAGKFENCHVNLTLL